jgi:hypothetical protein
VVASAALGQVSSEDFGFSLPLIHSSNRSTIITIYHQKRAKQAT